MRRQLSCQHLPLAILLLFAALATGCGQIGASEADFQKHRQKYLLATEPSDGLCVLDAREALADTSGEITVIGRIGGVADPWDQGRASFMMTDPSSLLPGDHDDEHACSDGCPYCATKKGPGYDASQLAIVQMVGQDGQVLNLDARELFDLKSDQMVVARGRAHIDELGHLVIAATGLYIRK